MALPGDEEPALHLGAYDGATLVGTGNVRREALAPPHPWPADGPAWRLRGMATLPPYRSRGVGALVLGGLLEHCRSDGGGIVWCNARIPAQVFYERAGLAAFGEPWEDPEIGPHLRMWTAL